MLLDNDITRVSHMIQAAEECLTYSHGRTQVDAENEPPLRHLLVHNLEIIGEAATRVSTEFCEKHDSIPWRKIRGMRNRLVHAYFDIDMDIVWETVQEVLPELLCQLRSILDVEKGE